MYCNRCAAKLKRNATKCPQCGQEFQLPYEAEKPNLFLPILIVPLLALLGLILLVAINTRDSSASFEAVEDLGWRVAGEAEVGPGDYKSRCTDPAAFEDLQAAPQQYQGVLYQVTGSVVVNEFLEETGSGQSEYLIILLTGDEQWWAGNYNSGILEDGPVPQLGETVTVYGSFDSIADLTAVMDIAYIEQ